MNMKERKNTRLKPYNYSQAGYYFLTICTKDHNEIFGKVYENEVKLNSIGEIVESKLMMINEIYEDVEIDNYHVIMPNHIHLILILSKNNGDDEDRSKMKVSKVIQQFKSASTKAIRNFLNKKVDVWQKSFYDRIIRNEKEFYTIRRYIELNPLKWDLEKAIPENLEL